MKRGDSSGLKAKVRLIKRGRARTHLTDVAAASPSRARRLRGQGLTFTFLQKTVKQEGKPGSRNPREFTQPSGLRSAAASGIPWHSF